MAIMNFMIQSLDGWNNLTWQAMLQVTRFNPSSRLVRRSMQMKTHLQEDFEVC